MAVDEVRVRILVADPDAHIFGGTLREVVVGRHRHADPSVVRALHLAAADDLVHSVPRDLGAPVASGGRNLSGGQRQRLRLARALIGEPEVLLAVDPTAWLDATTEAILVERLRAGRAGHTTVVATTSPLLLAQADEVHLLVDGRVVASGPHRTLLRQRADYRPMMRDGEDDPRPPDAAGAPSGPGQEGSA